MHACMCVCVLKKNILENWAKWFSYLTESKDYIRNMTIRLP